MSFDISFIYKAWIHGTIFSETNYTIFLMYSHIFFPFAAIICAETYNIDRNSPVFAT